MKKRKWMRTNTLESCKDKSRERTEKKSQSEAKNNGHNAVIILFLKVSDI